MKANYQKNYAPFRRVFLFKEGDLAAGPLLVTGPDGDSYTLLCEERSLEAARQLGLESVPVRAIEAGKESGETIAFQLTENLKRVATHGLVYVTEFNLQGVGTRLNQDMGYWHISRRNIDP